MGRDQPAPAPAAGSGPREAGDPGSANGANPSAWARQCVAGGPCTGPWARLRMGFGRGEPRRLGRGARTGCFGGASGGDIPWGGGSGPEPSHYGPGARAS